MKSIFYKLYKLTGISIVSAWLLIYFLIGQDVMSDIVLCFGADGHVKVEEARRGQCNRSAISYLQKYNNNSSLQEVSDPYGSCLDLSISQYVVCVQDTTSSQVKMSLLTAFSAPLPPFAEIVTEVLFPNPPPVSNSTLASLRTVILLT